MKPETGGEATGKHPPGFPGWLGAARVNRSVEEPGRPQRELYGGIRFLSLLKIRFVFRPLGSGLFEVFVQIGEAGGRLPKEWLPDRVGRVSQMRRSAIA